MKTRKDKDCDNFSNTDLRAGLKQFVQELSTRGSDVNVWTKRSPYLAYLRFRNVVEDSGATASTADQFYAVLETVKRIANRDEEKAIELLLSVAQMADKPRPKAMAVRKGIKRVRDPKYEELQWLQNLITKVRKTKFGGVDLWSLVEKKSYLLHKYSPEKENQTDYLNDFFVFPSEDADLCTTINDVVLQDIEILKAGLEHHTQRLFADYPRDEVKCWFVHAFREYSVRFLKDWKQFQRPTKSMPNFKKRHDLFVRFVNGETPSELGYTHNNYHHFTQKVVPQAIIGLLFQLYVLLYYDSDRRWIDLKDKADAVGAILTDVPDRQIPQFIDILKAEYPALYGLELSLIKPLKNAPF
jgi:hypothetical protein